MPADNFYRADDLTFYVTRLTATPNVANVNVSKGGLPFDHFTFDSALDDREQIAAWLIREASDGFAIRTTTLEGD